MVSFSNRKIHKKAPSAFIAGGAFNFINGYAMGDYSALNFEHNILNFLANFQKHPIDRREQTFYKGSIRLEVKEDGPVYFTL